MDTLLDYLSRFTVRAATLGFSRKHAQITITLPEGSVYYPPPPKAGEFNELFRQSAYHCILRPLLMRAGTGILTRLPSTTPLGYVLGPD